MEKVAISEKTFLANELPAGYEIAFETSFYNLPDFLELRNGHKPCTFYVCSPQQKSIIAGIKFHVDQGAAVSGGMGPFGSFDLSETIEKQELEFAIQSIKDTLISKSIKRIRIRHYPALYSPKPIPSLGPLLIAAGFEIAESQLNHHLETKQPFELQLHAMEQRKIQAMQSMGASFCQEKRERLSAIYGFIKSCRIERGQSISLELDELQNMADRFPSRYLLFAARIGDELAAASICVRVTNKVMYNFYPAFKEKYNRYSPLVYLLGKIHEFCRSNDVPILDLGTSEINGKLNANLSRFKDRLGGNTSLKYSFEWSEIERM